MAHYYGIIFLWASEHSENFRINMSISPSIVYVDEYIVLVNKPAGYLSIPDRFNAQKPNMVSFLKNELGEIFVCHRLDKETSGIMIFARTSDAHKLLSADFQNHSVRKKYLALVEGYVVLENGKIDKPIAESKASGNMMIISPKGKPSTTLFQTIKRYKKYSLIEAEILTGRMHQIRVHCNSIGHPLAIDAIYGNRDRMFISDIKQKGLSTSKFAEEKPIMERNSLHAFSLEFTHPVTKEVMQIEASLHKDFKALLTQLDKWGQ